MSAICKIILEFTRVDQASDPYAFRYAPQDYLLRSAGGGFEEATLPWSKELLDDLQRVQQPGRDPGVLHRIGDELRKFLAPAGWGLHEQTILRAVREDTPVYLTIRSAAAELYTLPWELLTIKSTGQLIGSMPGVLIRYEWPGTHTAPRREFPETGRVMVAWSAAAGPVPSEEHVHAIQQASAGTGLFDPSRDMIANATFSQLAEAIERAEREGPPISVLHILCHGAAHGSTFGLALDGDSPQDGLVVVDPGRLQQLLAPHADMIRLVVLSACDSGNAGELGNHLGSLAQMLHRAGLAAVVASRFPLSVAGSERLTKALYSTLCTPGGTVEAAFLATRRSLSHDARQLDWASIQLYTREEDGLQGALLAPPAPRQSPVLNFTAAAPVMPIDSESESESSVSKVLLGIVVGGIAVVLALIFAILALPDDFLEMETESIGDSLTTVTAGERTVANDSTLNATSVETLTGEQPTGTETDTDTDTGAGTGPGTGTGPGADSSK
ncbi:MAG: CHAT domain-containing protein, partial [Nannocystaceae bacterium]